MRNKPGTVRFLVEPHHVTGFIIQQLLAAATEWVVRVGGITAVNEPLAAGGGS